MTEYQILREQIRARRTNDTLTKRDKSILQQKIYLDLAETIKACPKCGRTGKLSLDHIVPEFLLTCFGVDNERELIEDNYTLLCQPCNQFKSNRIDFSNPKTKEILIRLLERV